MGWKSFFGLDDKKEETGPDPITGLTLSSLKVGYFVDYDLKTWEVKACHRYEWGPGDYTYEWQLVSHNDTIYLQKESEDEDEWTISRPIAFSRLGPGIKEHILEHDDPPDAINFEGVDYYMEEFGGGRFFKDCKGPGREFLSWTYEDDPGENFLSIEQWGEEDFEAFKGEYAEEYQFTNILPRE